MKKKEKKTVSNITPYFIVSGAFIGFFLLPQKGDTVNNIKKNLF